MQICTFMISHQGVSAIGFISRLLKRKKETCKMLVLHRCVFLCCPITHNPSQRPCASTLVKLLSHALHPPPGRYYQSSHLCSQRRRHFRGADHKPSKPVTEIKCFGCRSRRNLRSWSPECRRSENRCDCVCVKVC